MRKSLTVMILLALILSVFPQATAQVAAAAGTSWLDESNVDKGSIGIRYEVKSGVDTRLVVAKDGKNYTYALRTNQTEEWFALQLGNGDYTISLLENVSGTKKYRAVHTGKVTLNLSDSSLVYLNSIQNIDWSSNSKAVKKALELTKGAKTDTEKVTAVYNYIVANISYDHQLAAKVTNDYLPQIDRTFSSQKDICYGYAALMAGMLRSLDIPAKMVTGKASDVSNYHAWNEVYLDGKWITIDTTLDAGLKNSKKAGKMIKDSSRYTAAKVY
ncbi:transglutaminase-like domain-containing protein [Paenibacillus sp. Leaf72]|uniref:transglutaminase-like domain-containing protein n=1 Tax=Paenibacillus sp. Leaf72 TaxID=1736234 RepID=UPI0006F8A0D3|nr:transglutaminase-like domain-containing protein [Paenibacillus sp. Leaf72]KQN96273.1 transglutaminase [Paenibacillus sp. Leaf72]